MNYFHLAIDTRDDIPLRIKHPTLGEREFDSAGLKRFLQNITTLNSEHPCQIEIQGKFIHLSPTHLKHLQLNCRNISTVLSRQEHLKMVLRHCHD